MRPQLLIAVGTMLLPLVAAPPSVAREKASANNPPAGALTVLSLNVRYGTARDGENAWPKRRDLLFHVVRCSDPDLIGTQEVMLFQLQELLDALPGYKSLGESRLGGEDESRGEFSAILYRTDRLKPLASGTFWLSDSPEKKASTSWGNEIPRICTWARFEDLTDKQTFYVFNTHLDHRSQKSREKGVALIQQRIATREHHDPVLLTGDFNAGERNAAIERILSDKQLALVDTFRKLHPDAKEVGTFHGFSGRADGAKIDYVFAPPTARILKAEIVRDRAEGRYPTDHFPVLAVLRLSPSENE